MDTRGGPPHPLSALLFIGAVFAFVGLQEIGLRLRRAERRAWWAGTGRDLLNAAGFAAISSTVWLSGFPPPAALLLGGTLAFIIFGGYVFVATQTNS